MISFKPYYDTDTGRSARFSKSYTVVEALGLVKDFEGKVKLFEDYYLGWYLNPLKQILREGTSLITTAILLSFCEVLEQFQRGKMSNPSNTSDFVKSYLTGSYKIRFRRMNQKAIEQIINKIYNDLRNGLHHDLTTRGIHIYISNGVATMFQKSSTGDIELWFNPLNFLNDVYKNFDAYIKGLRTKSNKLQRSNFEQVFNTVFLKKLK